MAELDLTNPQHLAELLQTALPDFEDETPDRVEPHIEALERSDNDIYAGVGTGQRIDDDAPVEQADPEQADPKQQAPEPEQADPKQQAPLPEPEQVDPKQQAPLPKPDTEEFNEDIAQQQPLPLDMGGEGLLIGPEEVAAEVGGVPVRARRGWTEIDRHASKGLHEIYLLEAGHERSKPIRAGFTGRCHAARVKLQPTRQPPDAFIGTWIGTIEAKDHLLFSIEEVSEVYEKAFGVRRKVGRVDLITGSRFRGRRFSPVSVYLAYERDVASAKPIFYLLEGGSAKGTPEALYVSRSIDTGIHTQANFRFTPFTCNTNWYDGGLAMSEDKSEPACVYLTASQTRDGRHEYLKISVTYARDREMRRVIHPFELQVEAALRVMAIADEAQCELRAGSGRTLSHVLGPMLQALMQWDERPNGTTTPQERKQFCGCPKP